jgi:hypothetical protein
MLNPPESLELEDMEHGDGVSETAVCCQRPNNLRGRESLRFHIDVAETQRNQQHL